MTDVSERTALYRFFDAADRLLYVGVSSKPASRWKQHRSTKPWINEVAMRVIEWLPSREEALRAETEAIVLESPLYNVSRSKRPDKPGPPRPSMRNLRQGELGRGDGYLAIQDVANLIGMSPKAISTYRWHSKPGRTWADDPFPAQDGIVAHHPVWSVDRSAELQAWRDRHRRGRKRRQLPASG